MFRHAALTLTGEDFLLALVAERIDRLQDRMIQRGHSRLGLLGRSAHSAWLYEWVRGIGQLPVVCLLTCEELAPIDADHSIEGLPRVPVIDVRSASLATAVDTILVSDDLFEAALAELARDVAPAGTIVHRLYERLPTCHEPLPSAGAGRAEVVVRPVVAATAARR